MPDVYDVAVICLNGHTITEMAVEHPEDNVPHCADCGVSTISKCPACNTQIRGFNRESGGVFVGEVFAKAFCHACGQPYPWTAKRSEALSELIDELDELDEAERAKLKGSIGDLIAETPKTEVAGLRFKKAVAKIGKTGGDYWSTC